MKFALLTCEAISCRKEDSVNIGDFIQLYAIHQIYKEMGIRNEDIVYININNINRYDGEYIILPININLSSNWIVNIFPLPRKIIPVFIGLSFFSAIELEEEIIEYFKKFSPIGCRDEATLRLMEKYNIPAFLLGCVTFSLPKFEKKKNLKKDKIYLIDEPDYVEDMIPDDIKEGCEIVKKSHIYSSEVVKDEGEKIAEKILLEYVENAKLVISSRLYCIVPCVALGVPVIALVENCSERYSFVESIVEINTLSESDSINWNNEIKSFDKEKNIYKETIKELIKNVFYKYNNLCLVSDFYEKRKKRCYNNLYYDILKNKLHNLEDGIEYAIWGTGQIGMGVYKVMEENFSKCKIVAAIDSYCSGEFFGNQIVKPEKFCFDKKICIFVTTHSGEKEIVKYLKLHGYTENINYINFSTMNG
ncbi:polysaccharide pyruvyl transferase family protein [Butyribacter intestini]|uniref:polysaccharide pyruvyl transferase family protein n=1 Tax=Butyribacter intestini TaxID=1703332 RepID=UPI003AF1B356